MLVSGLLLVSTRAIAAVQVPETTPGLLSLWTDSYPLEFHDLDPGESAHIRLNVQLDDTDRGDLTLEVRKFGDLATTAGGLELGVDRCAVPWTDVPSGVTSTGTPVCASGRTALLSADPSHDYESDSPTWQLGPITDDSTVYMLVTLAIPSTTAQADLNGMDAAFGFGLFAEGEAVAAPIAPAALAFTGMDALSLLLVAVGAIGAGVVVSRSRAQGVKA
jgi:hypothetical protein